MNALSLTVVKKSFSSLVIAILLTPFIFAHLEPNLVRGQTEEEFTVKQTVTAELTFVVAPDDIVMDTGLGGITGGTSNGATSFRIRTNNNAGFNVTIKSDSDSGMIDDGGSGRFISHLDVAPSYTPQFSFTSAPANSSAFAYTVNASTTGDLDPAFLHNGSDTCGTGSSQSPEDACWIAATTTARTIINRSTLTEFSGSTSTLRFRVVIAANHNPTLPAGGYTSTTTLTATMN